MYLYVIDFPEEHEGEPTLRVVPLQRGFNGKIGIEVHKAGANILVTLIIFQPPEFA